MQHKNAMSNSPSLTSAHEFSAGLHIRQVVTPLRLSDFKLAVFDMDSTLINIECVDEIAAAAGCLAEVSAITEAAMRGEITDFKQSLRQRVALLKGVPETVLHQIDQHRLQLNPGVERFVQAVQAAGMKTVLVSGGFTFFSDRVRARLGLDFARANVLEITAGHLTGRLLDRSWGDIVDGEAKRQLLLDVCDLMGIAPEQAIAVGDGANDLPMMKVAGLSVAYHPKPLVQAQAKVVIAQGGLDRALELFEPRKSS
jgi:phosphoserine phosphatase